MHRRSGCLPDARENDQDPCCDRDHIASFTELQRQVVIELEMTERMPDQIDQRPELLAIAYPSLQLRKEVESAPVLIAELVKARAVRQQLG